MAQSITLGPIYNQQKTNVREWQITIELLSSKRHPIPITGLDMDVPTGAIAEYRTTNGLTGMKMTVSAPTTISIGKNLGKRNETNVLTQAHNECASKYRTKLKSGYSEKLSDQFKVQPDAVPIPMALKPWKDFGNRLEYPLYVQPKLDGTRMIALLDHQGQVVLKTRRRHDIAGFGKLKDELQAMYDRSEDKNIILDGETYAHGTNLQTISGLARAENGREDEKDTLQYWLFDCFCTKPGSGYTVDDPFDVRLQRLRAFTGRGKLQRVVINDTILIQAPAEADDYYDRMVADGYEGIIYKSRNKPYAFSFTKEKRSAWYLKRKQRFDDEFEIVSYGEGKGKDVGCVVFVLKTKEGVHFESVPNGTYDYRKELYRQCVANFDQFRGKWAKVQFEDWSGDRVPLRNRMIMIRDLAFD